MALNVRFVRLMHLGPDRVFLQWDVTGATEPGTYLCEVFRGQSTAGPWEMVATGTDLYHAIDIFNSDTPPVPEVATVRLPNLLSMAREINYRVVITPPSGAQVSDTSPIEPGLTGRQRQARRKMLRDEAVLLRKGNGVPVAVCKRARWGPRCDVCYDPYTGDLMRGECVKCFGTGFVPGFMAPVITYARRSPKATQAQISEGGKTETNNVQITLLDIPKVQDDDMLVFLRDNERYIVRAAGQTELQSVGVHQEIGASQLAYSSIEYAFKVDPQYTPSLF